MKKLFILATALAAASNALYAAAVVDFQDLTLANDSFYNGSDKAGKFLSRGAEFANQFTDFGGGFSAWSGFSYSNKTDTATAGFGNQYSALAGGGGELAGNSVPGGIYGVGFDGATLRLPEGEKIPLSLQVTNTTYAGLSMRNGDAFAKKFGGLSGNDPDFFLLTITGLGANEAFLGKVEFYLADFRFADNTKDYIVATWETVDLSVLGNDVAKLTFTFTSSDVGEFGINTPAYFAIDNIQTVPEPASLVLFAMGGSFLALRRRRN
ncbi:MAG: DUF4465 domain-containing protein [Verrucomicrobiota bacterium]